MTRRTVILPVLVVVVLAACLAALSTAPRQAQAAFPGENGRIVFETFHTFDHPSSLYSQDPLTGGDHLQFTRLTNNDGTIYDDRSPVVSPDGNRVVFARRDREASRYHDIFVVNTDGTGLTNLTEDPALAEFGPTWSPDGRKIAFAARPIDQWDGSAGVYVMDADGTDRQKLTDTEMDPSSGLDRLAWSPDGTSLAYSGGNQVYVMEADGSGERRIADGRGASWSPDAKKLAFTCRSSLGLAICTVNPDGSGQQTIATDRFEDDPDVEWVDDSEPSWSPDGTRMAFHRSIHHSEWTISNIYSMKPDGSELKLAAHKSANDYSPDWGPAPSGQPPAGPEPPETTIILGPSGASGRSVSFDFVASRVGTTFECSLDEAPFRPCSPPMAYGDLDGGSHAFRVRATDGSGADLSPAERSFAVDAEPPRGKVLIDGGRAASRTRAVELATTTRDPSPASGLASMRFRNAGEKWGAWVPYAESTGWKLSRGAGKKTVYARYRDEAGNVSTVARDSITFRR
jgi:Tol biopolymer transport system component